jgi:septal ring factor EnvC (AmiA/AmiB activator)
VAIPFGPRLDPRYRTKVPHNGVTLQTQPGAQVKAVFPGKVAFAAPFQGFGQTVIVQHAGRAFTLYAGLGQPETRQGAVLSLGQVLGVAGEQLYFEIRIENRPQDPLLWLRSAPR